MDKQLTTQSNMISSVRKICEIDPQVIAAVMYGSFSRGEGDTYSDIEFALFFQDDAFTNLNKAAWVAQITPYELFFADEVGHWTAIFSNLIRGEFHFHPISQIDTIRSWKGVDWFPTVDQMLIVDKTQDKTLSKLLTEVVGPPPERSNEQNIQSLANNFVNWILFGLTVHQRGEYARSLEILNLAHRNLLKLVRIQESSTVHWPTPSKCLEIDLSQAAYCRFTACTSNLDPAGLKKAFTNSWLWGVELIEDLSGIYGIPYPHSLIEKISSGLGISS